MLMRYWWHVVLAAFSTYYLLAKTVNTSHINIVATCQQAHARVNHLYTDIFAHLGSPLPGVMGCAGNHMHMCTVSRDRSQNSQ